MHELSIATSIIDLAQEEAEKRGAAVLAIHLKLGPLAGVIKEALLGSYELAAEGTPLAGSRLVINEVPVVVFCGQCGENRTLPSIQRFCCPVCQTPTPDVVQGEELQVTALELAS